MGIHDTLFIQSLEHVGIGPGCFRQSSHLNLIFLDITLISWCRQWIVLRKRWFRLVCNFLLIFFLVIEPALSSYSGHLSFTWASKAIQESVLTQIGLVFDLDFWKRHSLAIHIVDKSPFVTRIHDTHRCHVLFIHWAIFVVNELYWVCSDGATSLLGAFTTLEAFLWPMSFSDCTLIGICPEIAYDWWVICICTSLRHRLSVFLQSIFFLLNRQLVNLR